MMNLLKPYRNDYEYIPGATFVFSADHIDFMAWEDLREECESDEDFEYYVEIFGNLAQYVWNNADVDVEALPL